jgi:hypothetical protein
MFARNCVGANSWAASALGAWHATPTRDRRTGTPRAGSLVYFDDPRVSGEAGHVVYMAEGGYCYSNDILKRGEIDKVPLRLVHDSWGLRQLGWIVRTPSGAINLKPVTSPVPPVAPWLNPAYPRPGNSVPTFPGAAAFQSGKSSDSILEWGSRMVLLGHLRTGQLSHSWTSGVEAATKAFQLSEGWRGSDADGHPGSLTWKRAWEQAVPKTPWPRTLTPRGHNALLVGCALTVLGYGHRYLVGPSTTWGTTDHNALLAFQRGHGLPASGQTDLATWTRLGLS